MNCEEFVLPPMELALPLVKESLRCLLHTILFSRSIGGDLAVDPVLVRSDILGITYCRCSAEYNAVIESKIREFSQKLESSSDQALILVMSLYTPRQSKKSLWDILSQPFDDKAVFEKWKIQIDFGRSTASRSIDEEESKAIEQAAVQTKERVFFIIKRINERMDHLPSPPTEQTTYHFDISFANATRSGSSSLLSSPTGTSAVWSPKIIAQSIRSIPFIT